MRRDDVRGERALGIFLDRYLYPELIRQGIYDDIRREFEVPEQKKGVDLRLYKDGQVFRADEKARLHRINDPDGSLFFPLELERLDPTTHEVIPGWFTWDESVTDTYIMIRIPKADCDYEHLNRIVAEDFEEAEVFIVTKKHLKNYLSGIGLTDTVLTKQSRSLRDKSETEGRKTTQTLRMRRYRLKMTYSPETPEKSINLWIDASTLADLSDQIYRVSRGKLPEELTDDCWF